MTTAASQLNSGALQAARDATKRLSTWEKAQLLSELAQDIAQSALPTEVTATKGSTIDSHSSWARFRAVAADIRSHYPDSDITARVEKDRRERDDSMLGKT